MGDDQVVAREVIGVATIEAAQASTARGDEILRITAQYEMGGVIGVLTFNMPMTYAAQFYPGRKIEVTVALHD